MLKETLTVSGEQGDAVTRRIAVGAGTVWGPTELQLRRGNKLKKIVLLTDPAGKDEKLMDCLRILFPECVIETHPGRPETSGAISSAGEKTAARKKRDGTGKDAPLG